MSGNKIKSLDGRAAINLDEPLKDDLKRLSEENKRLVSENEDLKKTLKELISDVDKVIELLKGNK